MLCRCKCRVSSNLKSLISVFAVWLLSGFDDIPLISKGSKFWNVLQKLQGTAPIQHPVVSVFVCLFVCLSVCLFARSFVRSFVCLIVCSFFCSFVCLIVCLLVCSFVCLLAVCLLVRLFACFLVLQYQYVIWYSRLQTCQWKVLKSNCHFLLEWW